ncbi:MAG: DUF4012 domain-containing protein, partial [Anaerolineales bacterium]|nr:DUF4012 domain-containing protein [Anaerolineales bacterium]
MEREFVELKNRKTAPGLRRSLRWLAVFLLVAALGLAGIKGWRIYQKGLIVYEDATALRGSLRSSLEGMDFKETTSAMTELQGDLDEFAKEARPLLWLAPKLGWVPTYGGDLANAPNLIELADQLIGASIVALEAAEPLLAEINSPGSALDPAGVTALLVDAQPRLLEARREFDQALEVRNRIEAGGLSPRLQGLLTEELDPLLALMDDGLSLSTTLPLILGADGNGPKTYLLLAQNEDELRPTGGFITTVGRLVLHEGEIVSLEFESVDNREDWTKPYPAAPWQLQEYMNADVLILRDSNWFADFPTSAMWAEYLYGYDHPEPMDGVIAFDQQFLVMLLSALGPLEVEGAPYPITGANVIEYMRSAKEPPADQPVPSGWYRKEFIGDIADALLDKLMNGRNNNWRALAVTLTRALEERHLLLQFDDPAVTSLLAERGWDNAVRPIGGDFLMTTDTNIGFNKTNALVEVSLSYDVDLTDLSAPTAALVVTHTNNASADAPCVHFDTRPAPEDYAYPMDRCYWAYLRAYKQAGVELTDAALHEIPAEWMLLERSVPARVDELDEQLDGARGFGALIVVPGGQSLSTSFEFSLPTSV